MSDDRAMPPGFSVIQPNRRMRRAIVRTKQPRGSAMHQSTARALFGALHYKRPKPTDHD